MQPHKVVLPDDGGQQRQGRLSIPLFVHVDDNTMITSVDGSSKPVLAGDIYKHYINTVFYHKEYWINLFVHYRIFIDTIIYFIHLKIYLCSISYTITMYWNKVIMYDNQYSTNCIKKIIPLVLHAKLSLCNMERYHAGCEDKHLQCRAMAPV